MKRIIIIALVMLACGIAFKANSQKQPIEQVTFKAQVAIHIVGQDKTNIQKALLSYNLKREMQMLGDVEIVGYETGEWEQLISCGITPTEYQSGNTSKVIVVTINIYSRVSEFLIEEEIWDAVYPGAHPIRYPYTGNVLITDTDKIEETAKIITDIYIEEFLQESRDRWRQYPKDPDKLLDYFRQKFDQKP